MDDFFSSSIAKGIVFLITVLGIVPILKIEVDVIRRNPQYCHADVVKQYYRLARRKNKFEVKTEQLTTMWLRSFLCLVSGCFYLILFTYQATEIFPLDTVKGVSAFLAAILFFSLCYYLARFYSKIEYRLDESFIITYDYQLSKLEHEIAMYEGKYKK